MRPVIATVIFVSAGVAQPAFEVATIKASPPQPMNQMRVSMGGDAGRINYTAVNLKNLLSRAYGVKGYQISGPSWLDSERYDVTAKIPDGVPQEQVPAMLRVLLEERFKLKSHRETKELPVYEMVQAKGGPKMDKSQEEGRPRMQMEGGGDGIMKMKASAMTMPSFSDALAGMVGRPVIDKTDLGGSFDFSMDIAMQDLTGSMVRVQRMGPGDGGGERNPAPDNSPGGSLFTSIQKLGLKLEAKRSPVEILVVDQAEKVPAEN